MKSIHTKKIYEKNKKTSTLPYDAMLSKSCVKSTDISSDIVRLGYSWAEAVSRELIAGVCPPKLTVPLTNEAERSEHADDTATTPESTKTKCKIN